MGFAESKFKVRNMVSEAIKNYIKERVNVKTSGSEN